MHRLTPRGIDLEQAGLTVFYGIASTPPFREAGSFRIAEIGRDRPDLRFGQIMCSRPRDGYLGLGDALKRDATSNTSTGLYKIDH